MSRFDIHEPSPARTRDIGEAYRFVTECRRHQRDWRDILKALGERYGSLSYPSYRTGLRIGGIYTEAATGCHLKTSKILVRCFLTKAEGYLARTNEADLFANGGHARIENDRDMVGQ